MVRANICVMKSEHFYLLAVILLSLFVFAFFTFLFVLNHEISIGSIDAKFDAK